MELLKNVVEKLKREKVGFFVTVLMSFLLNVFFSEYIFSSFMNSKTLSETVVRVYTVLFFVLPILFVRLFIFKEKIKDLFHPKVLINLILIILLIWYKNNILDFDLIPKIYAKIIRALIYNFAYFFLFSLNKENKIFISFVDLFKTLYKKQNLVLFLFLIVILNDFFNFPPQYLIYFGRKWELVILQGVFFVILSIIKTFIIVLIYDVIECENKISKYLKGKFSKLYLQLFGINLVIALILILINRISDYLTKEKICSLFLILIIAIYLIREFEIRGVLKIYNIEERKELICGKNLVSYLILMIKIATILGVSYLCFEVLGRFHIYFSSNTLDFIYLFFIFYICYSMYYGLTVEFVKGRLNNMTLKFYKIMKNKKILILSLGGLALLIINFKNVSSLEWFVIGVGTLYVTCSIVYEILEKNGYLEEEK